MGGGTRINWCVLPAWVAVLPAHCRILSMAARIAIGRSLWMIVLSMDRTADLHPPDVSFMGELNICIFAIQCRSASFPTPAHVRREWAEEHGLSAFQSSEYDAALDAVTTRLGVTVGAQPYSLTLRGNPCTCTVITNQQWPSYLYGPRLCRPVDRIVLHISCHMLYPCSAVASYRAKYHHSCSRRHLGAQQSQCQAEGGAGKAGTA